MYTYKGKTALITGASSGIGAAFAQELALQKMNLIIVARSEDKLKQLAGNLMTQHNIQVDVIVADLAQEDAAQHVYDQVTQLHRKVDLLINNAGAASYGFFDELPLNKQQDEIKLNVFAMVSLTHFFLQDMLARQHGAIINISSVSGFQPNPFMAVYGATKAFVTSWSEALWAENRKKGIAVITLCPGRTKTNIYEAMGGDSGGPGKDVPPAQVVQTGLRALEKGKMTVVDGVGNYFITQSTRIFPRKVVVGIAHLIFSKNATNSR